MNKHTKIAILVAPLLMVLGYIASDLFIENQAEESKLIVLEAKDKCQVLQGSCILSSNEFQINVFDKQGMTTVNSTFPLDKAVLFLVDENDIATAFPLSSVSSQYYWHSATPLRDYATHSSQYKLRLIASIKGGEYISEFTTQL